MTKVYTKISDTEVKLTETSEVSVDTICTVAILEDAIADIEAEMEQLTTKKAAIEAELAIVEETLNPV